MRIKSEFCFLLLFVYILIYGVPCSSQNIIEYTINRNIRGIDSLLKADPSCVHQTDERGASALHYAAWFGDTISAELLLKNGAKIDHQDNTSSTPLVWAVYNRKDIMSEFLLNHDADIKWHDRGSNNLLHLATSYGMTHLMELFLEKGMKVNEGNKYSVTPLHIAASINSAVMARALLNHGADPSLVCSSGKNAFHCATDYESDSVLMILKSIMKEPGEIKFPDLYGEYLGMKIPDTIPELFAPGLLITPFFIHGQIAFSENLEEMVWSDNAQPVTRIWYLRMEDGKWTVPAPMPFSEDFYSAAPYFSADGKRLYFYSTRPEKPGGDTLRTIWYVERENDSWSQPVRVSVPGWESKFIGFPSFSKKGNLFFYSNDQENNLGFCDVYISEFKNGSFSKPENPGVFVNSPSEDLEPAISPDENYMVFSSTRQDNIQNNIELYVSFKNPDGSWTPATNLGSTVNRGRTWRPYITPDGRFLFYNSDHTGIYEYFWVSTDIIKNLRQKYFTE